MVSQFSSYFWRESSWRVRGPALVLPLLPYLASSRLVFQIGALVFGAMAINKLLIGAIALVVIFSLQFGSLPRPREVS